MCVLDHASARGRSTAGTQHAWYILLQKAHRTFNNRPLQKHLLPYRECIEGYPWSLLWLRFLGGHEDDDAQAEVALWEAYVVWVRVLDSLLEMNPADTRLYKCLCIYECVCVCIWACLCTRVCSHIVHNGPGTSAWSQGTPLLFQHLCIVNACSMIQFQSHRHLPLKEQNTWNWFGACR